MSLSLSRFFFFFNDTATTEIYSLSLHDALPIFRAQARRILGGARDPAQAAQLLLHWVARNVEQRSEEHTSELQSRPHLVCRLLLEKKKSCVSEESSVARAETSERGVEWLPASTP